MEKWSEQFEMNGQFALDNQVITDTPKGSRLARMCILLLMAFPIIDFALRLPGIHPLGLVWDKFVLVALFAVAVTEFMKGYRPVWLPWHRFAGWYLIFGLALMFAGMGDPLVALQGYRIDIYYMLYALLIPFVLKPEDVPDILHFGACVAILIAVHGVYQYITKAPIPGNFVDSSEHVRTRVYSVLESPNELGAYMALLTPIVAGLSFYERERRRKWLYGIGAVLCAATLVFTLTRAAWVSLAIAILIVSFLFERRLLLVLLILAVVAFFLPPIHHRIADLLSPVYWMKATQSGRIYKWLLAFDKMAGNPLFGVGLGHFGGAVSALYHGGIYSDNYYAKTLGETGLVGLTLFLTIHAALVRDVFKLAVKPARGREKYVILGGLTGIIAVLVHNSMENVFENATMDLTYFLYAALFLIWCRSFVKEGTHETI